MLTNPTNKKNILTRPRACLTGAVALVNKLLVTAGLSLCRACQRPIENNRQAKIQGLAAGPRSLCAECALTLCTRSFRCIQCGLSLGPRPVAFGWVRCRHCKPNADDRLLTLTCFDYVPPISHWLLQLKYGNQPAIAKTLAECLGHHFAQSGLSKPQVLIPVPSSKNRIRKRGYNQSTLIARHLGRNLGIPVVEDFLVKARETGNQASIGKANRRENLKNAFICTELVNSDLTIGLVDDVITTGSTLLACRTALENAGARRFVQLAICRTPE